MPRTGPDPTTLDRDTLAALFWDGLHTFMSADFIAVSVVGDRFGKLLDETIIRAVETAIRRNGADSVKNGPTSPGYDVAGVATWCKQQITRVYPHTVPTE